MIEIRKTEVFARWMDGLRDLRARARIQVGIERLPRVTLVMRSPLAKG